MKDDIKDRSIVLIGAGNLAVNLGKALSEYGFNICQVYSRTEESARSLAVQLNADWTISPDHIISGADLYIVSLKDAAFIELLPRIVKDKEDALWVHTAGSIPMSVWEGKATNYGVLYPLQTFSKQRTADFSEIPFFIEANTPENAHLLKQIAAVLSNKVYEIDSNQRKNIHLAAVFACNFTNHLYVLASDILQRNNIPFDVILPLIDETARKIHTLTPREAQTGPAIRYDENIIHAHLDMLSGNPEMQEIYRLLSANIHRNS